MKPAMRLGTSRGIIFFICVIVLCFIFSAILMFFLARLLGNSTTFVRVSTLVQDIVLFIVPAILTALVVTRYPARFLAIDRMPQLQPLILSVITLLVAIPAVNWIVAVNEAMTLPPAFAAVEQAMRHSEELAEAQISVLLGGSGVGSLIVSLLIVGVLAGFSEEIFFRGTLQRLLTDNNRAPHSAIWVTAFIFSAIHLQFYGFIPRLLLGAWFGYLLYWSGSLWLPAIIHALNNSFVVIARWGEQRSGESATLDSVGSQPSEWWLVVISTMLTVACIYLTYKSTRNKS